MTKTLRPNELGILTLGTDSGPWGIALPPKIPRISINTFCHNSCVRDVNIYNTLYQIFKNSGNKFYVLKRLANQNLTLISTIPHTHTTGIAMYTKIIRNGIDIGYVLENERYDFNYQVGSDYFRYFNFLNIFM